ncbi:MAG TPA: TIGR02466 family protein [Chloroflexota bacterium]|jgi:uncharacterized protein (TIGR02466 family)
MKLNSGFLFGTPIVQCTWPDGPEINPQLREAILEHASKHPGVKYTNIGGWHSEAGQLEFCGNAGQQLIRHMYEMTNEATAWLYAQNGRTPEPMTWGMWAWAIVNQRGDHNSLHTHPGATWSGVYYVDQGESEPDAKGTPIQLYDANQARSNTFFPSLMSPKCQINPKPGLMILFPSYVAHAVPPHQGDRPRISIAFNMRKEPFP